MSFKRLLAVSFVIACVIQVQGADKYTDEKRPYEFGFTIDGEQHRHEKKDEKGLIMGEFGFITADGVYHVTVYATDEQGRFKILSMKNIRVKPYPSYKQSTGSARQGHALDVASEQTLTPASTTIAPIVSTTQAFKRISIEPPARSCSSCSIPTTSTAAPVIPQVPANASPNFPANSPANIPGPQIAPGNPNYPEQNQQTLGSPNYPSSVNNPSIPNRSNFPAPNSPVFSNQPSFPAPQQPQIPQSPQQNVPYQPQPQQQPQAPVNYPQKDLSLPKEPQYNVPEINAPQETPLTQVQPEAQPPQGALQSGRTPKRFDGDIPQSFVPQNNIGDGGVSQSLVPSEPPKKPVLINAQMQIVDKNTDIYKKGPGEKDGLPDGLTTDDMSTLLYTFNYTVGFHGHFEEGYTSGVKQGYYFVTGRNGVRTRVDYVADSKGFRPKITQEVLDLLSDDVPKAETEKEAKYGLKGYEFKWLYYPVESKGR